MRALPLGFAGLTDGAGGFVVDAILQGTVVVAVVLVLARLLRNAPAGCRYALLLLALVKLAVPPTLASPTSVFGFFSSSLPTVTEGPSGRTLQIDGVKLEGDRPANRRARPSEVSTDRFTSIPEDAAVPSILVWLAVAWAIGASWRGVHVLRGSLALRRLVREARPAEGALRKRLERWRQELGVSERIRFLVSNGASAPICFGILRPTVLLPAGIDPKRQRTVVGHELIHLRHCDPWVAALQVGLSVVWWFHPLVWRLQREIRHAREDWCDDTLISRGWATRDAYCETLIHVAAALRDRSEPPAVVTMAPARHDLARRFERILSTTERGGLTPMFYRISILVLALGLLPGAHPSASGSGLAPTPEEPKADRDIVGDGIAWLARQQHADGYWVEVPGDSSTRVSDAESALAVLAFLGNGETTASGPHREVVLKGVVHLSRRFREPSDSWELADAIAATALLESQALTADPRFAAAVAPMIARIEKYYAQFASDADPETVFWSAMALLSARQGGAEIDKEIFGALVRHLSYEPHSDGMSVDSVRAASLFLRLLSGGSRDDEDVKSLAESIRAAGEASSGSDVALMHLGSYALFQFGGPSWAEWRTRTLAPFLGQQIEGGNADGSWDPPVSFVGTRVGATAHGVLGAEVSFRYARVTGEG